MWGGSSKRRNIRIDTLVGRNTTVTGDLRFTPYSDAYLYYLLPDRPPATRYIEMDPGVANAPDSGLADEVAHAGFVVLSTVWDDWDEPNDSRVAGSDAPVEQLLDNQGWVDS